MSYWIGRVTGRNYHDLKDVHCFECDRRVAALQRTQEFLRMCAFVECGVLICPKCRADHEAIHKLAGDVEVDRWRKTSLNWRFDGH